MLVSVYLLRRGGVRLPLDEVRASTPRRGYVRVKREPGGHVGHWQRTALLMAQPASTEVVMQLHDVHLQSWDDRGLVLAGVAMEWRRKERQAYRQSWFVVLPPSPEGDQPEFSGRGSAATAARLGITVARQLWRAPP